MFGVASLTILGTAVACFAYYDEVVAGRFKCDESNRVFDLMATLIASALALYAGRKQT